MPQHLAFTVQELMETITSSESLPRRLTSSQRKRRLEEERRLPEEDVKKAERAIRRSLWNRHLDNVSMSMRIRPSHCCMNEFFGNDGITTQRSFSFLKSAVSVLRLQQRVFASRALGTAPRALGTGLSFGRQVKLSRCLSVFLSLSQPLSSCLHWRSESRIWSILSSAVKLR